MGHGQNWSWAARAVMVLLVGAMATSGCGDVVGSSGDYGNLYYALFIDYDAEYEGLDENRLITGYDHQINVHLTAQGQEDVDRPSEIAHDVDADIPVGLAQINYGTNQVPDLIIDVAVPGPVTLESHYDGRLLDKLELHFDTPDAIDLVTYVRPPWDDDFDATDSDVISVEEGAQLMLVPIPVTNTGHRLVGDISTVVEIDPEWAAVPGMNVNGVYEDGYWGLGGADSWYIIEPGNVTFTFVEVVSGAIGTRTFLVDPAAP